MTSEEIYNANGLQILFFAYDWCAYTLRTSLYSITVCEDYRYDPHRNWHVSIRNKEDQKTLFETNTFEMPELLKPITGSECRKLKTAEEVDSLAKRLVNLKCFL